MLKILDLATHIGAQEHLIWGTMLRLRLPICVCCLKLGSLLLPTHVLSFEKDIAVSCASCCKFQISRARLQSSWQSRVKACVQLLKNSAVALENVRLLIFKDMHHCAPLRMVKSFLCESSNYIYKKLHMLTVSRIFTVKTPQDHACMIGS